MLGSRCFSYLVASADHKPQDTLKLAVSGFCISTVVCAAVAGPGAPFANKAVAYIAFLALEFSIGVYFPSAGCLRSEVVPESHRATVCNWYRVPMNLITCATLLAVNAGLVAGDKRPVFAVCAILLAGGVAISSR